MTGTRDREVDMSGWRRVEDKGIDLFVEVAVMELFSTDSILDSGVFDGSLDGELASTSDKSRNFTKEVIVYSDFRSFIVPDEYSRNNSIRVQFGSLPSIDIYVRRPVSLVQGLAKIGGFLGFLKVFSIFLSVFHEGMFVRDLKKVMKPEGEGDLKKSEVSSSESLLIETLGNSDGKLKVNGSLNLASTLLPVSNQNNNECKYPSEVFSYDAFLCLLNRQA